MPSVIRRYFQLEKPRFHQFLAHCIVRRALRTVPEMNLSDPPVIGIIAGENPPVDEIQDALTLLRLPDLEVLRTRFPDSLTVFLDCEPTSSTKPKKLEKTEEEFLIALKGKKAIFAVAEEEEDLPDLFRKISDKIVHLEGPTPRHIKAAFAYCVGVEISAEEAEQLTKHSLFDLTMAASRGRSWRKVLDAITEEKSGTDSSQEKTSSVLRNLQVWVKPGSGAGSSQRTLRNGRLENCPGRMSTEAFLLPDLPEPEKPAMRRHLPRAAA